MNYLLIVVGTALSSFTNIFIKKYKLESNDVKLSGTIFVLLTCIVATFFFASMAGWNVVPNIPTLIFSIILATVATVANLLTLALVNKADLVTISVFGNAGSIILSFLFGTLFLKEEAGIFKIISLIILGIVITFPAFTGQNKTKTQFLGYLLCLLLFLESGVANILYKIYAIYPKKKRQCFRFLGNVFMIPYTLFVVIKASPKKFIYDIKKLSPKAYLFSATAILATNFATVLSIFVLKNTNLVIYSLLKTPLMLILTAIIAKIFLKDKITKQMIFSTILSTVAIIFSVI